MEEEVISRRRVDRPAAAVVVALPAAVDDDDGDDLEHRIGREGEGGGSTKNIIFFLLCIYDARPYINNRLFIIFPVCNAINGLRMVIT